LTFHGVALGESLAYDMMSEVLDAGLHAFARPLIRENVHE
jgi:hypothetical protein